MEAHFLFEVGVKLAAVEDHAQAAKKFAWIAHGCLLKPSG
jgi:hypothetical protein